MPKFLAFIVVVLIIGGVYFFQKGGELPAWFRLPDSSKTDSGENTESKLPAEPADTVNNEESTALNESSLSVTNYEDCISAGNKPLDGAPDKCLTLDGHVFIKGVIEE